MSVTFRPIVPAELDAFVRCLSTAYGYDLVPESLIYREAVFEYDRSLSAFDGEELVGTTASFTYDMPVPGGRVPTAGVTMVSVKPTHRRQGVATTLLCEQLRRERERGDLVAALWSSESSIYGRFGYGPAAEAVELQIERAWATFAHLPPIPGRVRLVDAERAREQWPAIWDRARVNQPGMMPRSAGWWGRIFRDPAEWRAGFTANTYANYEVDGVVRGFIRYRVQTVNRNGLPAGTLRIHDLIALTDDAYAALWRYAFGVDLIATIEAGLRPVEEPLSWMLADPRRLQRRTRDALWVRLLDVRRALAARRYAIQGRVVLDVADPLLPENAGCFALTSDDRGSHCQRTEEPAEITLGVAELGSVYLGGPRLATLARAGRVGGDPEAIRRASLMFGWERAPWCPEIF